MIRWYIKKIITSEIDAAKKQGMKEGLSKTAEKVIKKYLDKNLGDAVMEHATKPAVCKEFSKLAEAALEEDRRYGYHDYMTGRPLRFMQNYFQTLKGKLKQESSDEANNILNQFISQKATNELKEYIADPEQLKFIIGKINEFQVNSTGSVK